MNGSIKQNNNHSDDSRYLCFMLGKEKFGIPLLQVKEVIAQTNITAIPQAPAYFKGIMNLRGQIVSVIDLRSKLKIVSSEVNQEVAIVILDISGLSLGVVVDSVDSVVVYPEGVISPPPDHDSGLKVEYIVGVAREKDHITLILDLQKVLNTEDMKSLRKNQKVA
ncbi:MAG: purine-binding chemotaxis protein CheW [Bdellovibrionaceae bacterium]|nr:purine-binding chemotaxis protein CheW [Pseudobdellovibrionaceae bacterium]